MFKLSPDGALGGRLRRLGGEGLLVLEGVTVIDGTGAPPREGATLVVRGDRIIAEVPRGGRVDLPSEPVALRLDLRGMFVTPGLIDAHVHLTGYQGRDPYRRHLERYPVINVLRAARDANRVLEAGFTTVRHLGHGDPRHTQGVKDAIANGLIAGPRMLTSGYAISQTGGHGNQPAFPYHLVEELRPRSAFADGPDACRKLVRQILGDGADLIKIYTTEGIISSPSRMLDIPNFTMEEIEAITDEAHRRGVRVAAHATGLEGARNAVQGGVDSLEHGPNELDEDLVRLMRANGTTFTPTLGVFEWAAAEGGKHGLEDWAVLRTARMIPGRRAFAHAAHAAGVPLALGSDSGGAPRGGRNAEEIGSFVRAGLSPVEAIRAATEGGARSLGILDEVGTIAAGKVADLLVLSKDPLADPAAFLDPLALRLVFQGRITLEPAA